MIIGHIDHRWAGRVVNAFASVRTENVERRSRQRRAEQRKAGNDGIFPQTDHLRHPAERRNHPASARRGRGIALSFPARPGQRSLAAACTVSVRDLGFVRTSRHGKPHRKGDRKPPQPRGYGRPGCRVQYMLTTPGQRRRRSGRCRLPCGRSCLRRVTAKVQRRRQIWTEKTALQGAVVVDPVAMARCRPSRPDARRSRASALIRSSPGPVVANWRLTAFPVW